MVLVTLTRSRHNIEDLYYVVSLALGENPSKREEVLCVRSKKNDLVCTQVWEFGLGRFGGSLTNIIFHFKALCCDSSRYVCKKSVFVFLI